MTEPVVSYFDFPGSRGEECRLAFVLAGVAFKDDRIKHADWPARKAATPFGRLPVLTLEGKPPLPECNAILRYVAREHGLELEDPWQRAQCDALMEACEDLRGQIWRALRVGDSDEEKQAARQELAAGPLQDWARAVEPQLQGPFAFGDTPTVLDIKLFMIRHWLTSGIIDHLPTNVWDEYPKIEEVCRSLAMIPEIAAFREKYAR